jgi:hypothetical protein
LTGFNLSHDIGNILALTDIDGMEGEVAKYCREHPAETFGEAVEVVSVVYYATHHDELLKHKDR